MNKLSQKIGVGINYRNEICQNILDNLELLDCVEIFTEKFFIKDHDARFEKIINNIPILLHGLDMSIGSSEPISEEYLSNLKSTLNNVNHLWFSDHLSLTKEAGIEVGHLMPIKFSEEVADKVIANITHIQNLSAKPFLLENITYYYKIPGSTMSEVEFIKYILDKSDCGMLLDINNLYINALNHKYDPRSFLENLPLDRVVEAHLAGGSYKYNMMIDTHANPISSDVWELCDYVVSKTPLNCIIIERDSNLPDFNELLTEVASAKEIMRKYGRL